MNPGLLIHYGADIYDPAKFKPVTNDGIVKPRGGLWTSPVNSEHDWGQWCMREEFYVDRLDKSFTLQLKPTARLFIIDSKEDLNRMPVFNRYPDLTTYGHEIPSFDFERMADTWDAIWLTARGEWATRFSHPASLYGWDCETVFIMNKEAIQLNTKIKKLF